MIDMHGFDLQKSIEILTATPQVLTQLLHGLSPEWISCNEGPETWSAYDIIGHLIHGEQTDWIVRLENILSNPKVPFEAFDRFAQFKASEGKTIHELLETFARLREQNLNLLSQKQLTQSDLLQKGLHPALGEVTLGELLATWTAHDLGHIAQICRVMAKQYQHAVGPWREYLPVMDR